MRNPRWLASILVLAALLSAPPSRAAHPQTVWDATEFQRLRDARTTTHAALFSNLATYASDNRAKTLKPSDLGGYTMAVLLAGDALATDNAVKQLRTLCAWAAPVPTDANYSSNPWRPDCDFVHSGTLHGASLAYDLLYSYLTDTERAACRNHIARSAAALDLASRGDNSQCQPGKKGYWRLGVTNNHHWVNYAAIGLAGHALEGEHADAGTWRDRGEYGMAQVYDLHIAGTGGSTHEGIGYHAFGLERMMYYFLGAIRRNPTYSTDKSDLMRSQGRYLLTMQHPNHPRQFTMTAADANWVRPEVLALLRWTAKRFQDPYAQEAARRWDLESRAGWRRAEYGGAYALEYIMYDPNVPAFNPASLPLDNWTGDQESFTMRSSWAYGASGTASQGIVAVFKAGNLGGRFNYNTVMSGQDWGEPGSILNISHDHEDDLSLWIYGRGGWQLPEATAYNCCYDGVQDPLATDDYHRTAWHNSFLIDGQGQLGDTKVTDRQTAINPAQVYPWYRERFGTMPWRASTDHYAFARGDGRRLYPSALGVSTLLRTVAFSREGNGFLVLQDRIALAGGVSRNIEQLFHSMRPAGEAAITGQTGNTLPASTTGNADAPWIRLDNSTRHLIPIAPMHASDTALGIRVVSPASYTAQFSAQSSNNYAEWYHHNGNYGLTRVSAGGPRSSVTFLELLWPTTNAEWASRPNVQPVDAGAPDKGFSVPAGGTTEYWLFNTGGVTTTVGSFTLAGSSEDDIAVARFGASCSDVQRIAFSGSGTLSHTCDGTARLLLDTGARSAAVEIAISGARADISGIASANAIRFHGPAITDVRLNGASIAFTKNGSTVVIGVPAPTRQWQARPDTVNLSDRVTSVATDSQGNVYFAQLTHDTYESDGPTREITVNKYTASGAQAAGWPQRLSSPGQDYPTAIVVDSARSSVYVVGYTDAAIGSGNTHAGLTDGFMAKFGTAGGAPQWVRMLGTAAYDELRTAAVDSSGNLIVAGWSKGCFSTSGVPQSTCGKTRSSAIVARVSSAGAVQWLQEEGSGVGTGTAFEAVALGSQGEVYLLGTDEIPYDFTTQGKLNLWRFAADLRSVTWKRSPLTENTQAWGLAVDSARNIFIVADRIFINTSFYVKYDDEGRLLTTPATLRGSVQMDEALAVATSGTDFIVAGTGPGPQTCRPESCYSDMQWYVVRFNSMGDPLWEHMTGMTGGIDDWAEALTVDSAGNVIAAGATNSDRAFGSTVGTGLIIKYSP